MEWFFVIITLIFQEFASTGAALFSAHAANLNPWIIHGIWIVATVGDIAIGFYGGKWIHQKFRNSKLDAWANKWATKIDRAIGKTGVKISLILLGFVTYPYIVAFAASWLSDLALQDIFLYTTLGNAAWYAFTWATVLGITAAGHNYQLIFTIIAVAGIVLVLISNFIKKKIEV
jgi:hypothetical protein